MQTEKISFSNYFQHWLYGDNGYYTHYKSIGKEGDFYTAVSSSSFFGGAIGKHIVSVIEESFLPKNTTIVEIGAHHGYLLADIIQFIFTLNPSLIQTLHFVIIEKQKHLQIKQKEYFQKCFGDQIHLTHYDDISKLDLETAFVVANEIFDAFACDIIFTDQDTVLQKGLVHNHTIEFTNLDTTDKEDTYLFDYCKRYNITKGEVARGYEKFTSHLSKNIKKFEFLTFDYGERYPRNDFSCRIYAQHSVYSVFDEKINLNTLYQKSDITYDVHFQHLIDCFEDVGVQNIQFQTQLKALVEFGIIELLEILHKNVDEKTYLSEANKVKTLLNPTGMGDRFKMARFRQNNL